VDPTRRVNPYIAGSPVTGTEMFFGREDVFSFVRRNLTGRHRDTPIVLYGQRRTGKTSVLYQMHRHLDPRYRCIFIDLHGLNLNGVENLLWGLATSIKRGLQRDHQLSVAVPDRAAFSASPHAAFETTFLDAVWSLLGEDHLVLMIDEVVRLHEEVRAGRLEREIFDYLRHLMQHFERLNFVFSLGSGVEEMRKDYAFLFGVALYHRISFLEPAAARALITQPAQDCYQVMLDGVEKILQITSGHPYYTQLVCHCLFDRWLRAQNPQVTSADVDAVLSEAIELGSANLTYVWEDSAPEEQAMMAGMAAAMLAGGSAATADQIREVWHKAGVRLPAGQAASAARNLTAREVVVASNGAYSFAVDLQRLWLDKHRRLDWVKEDLEEPARKWSEELAQKGDRSAEDKPPGQQQAPRFRRGLILLIGSGILALIVIVIVIVIVVNSSSSPTFPELGHSFAVAVSPTPTLSGQANSALGRPYVITQDGVPAATVTITAVQITTVGEGSTAPQNGYFAIVTVTVTVMPNFNQDFYISAGDFQALVNGVHIDGTNGNAAAAISNSADEFGYNVTLGAGQKITKKLPFDVPSKHGTILYAPPMGATYSPVIARWNY
jgi:putative ATPase